MDGRLFSLIHETHTPKINPDIANGIALKAMKGVERYIDKIIRSAEPGFPEGLVYGWSSKGGIGFERCTPWEEYSKTVARKTNRSTFELARSDLYMVKLYFEFKGVELEPRHIYLPYVRDAGLIALRGSTYSISPVLADKAISLGRESMFVALPRAKLTFERRDQHFYTDDTRQTVKVVYSQVHNERRGARRRPGAGRPTIHGQTTMMHYLLCKYGLVEAFRRFADTAVEFGYPEKINVENYPPAEWTICKSTQMKPRSLRTKVYQSSEFRVAIRNKDFGPTVQNMVGGLFYVVDHFPDNVKPEYFCDNGELVMWRILLGQFIWGGDNGSVGKLIEDVNAHFDSLDEYIDEESREMLKADAVPCDNVYDLFFHAIKILSTPVVLTDDQVASMYDKNLMILRYALFDITSAIFKFMYQLKKNTRSEVTEKDITDTMRRILTPELIMKLNHDHGEINSVSSPGDNKYFKITSNLVQQTSSTGKGKNRAKTNLVDPSKFLHSSIAEVGSYAVLPKSSPDGRSRVNPFLQLTDNFKVVQTEKHKVLLDKVQEMIKR